MSVVAWVVLGLAAGLFTNMVTPGKWSRDLPFTCLVGAAGALIGGLAASDLIHMQTQGFFNVTTWLTAVAGAVVLLLASHLLAERSSRLDGLTHH